MSPRGPTRRPATALALAIVAATLTAGIGCGRGDVREWRPSDHEPPRPDEMAAQSAGNEGAPDPAAVMWSRLCAGCHGAGGHGDGPMAGMARPPDLTTDANVRGMSEEALREAIQQGRGQMPGFGQTLDPADVNTLVRFVRRLVGRR